MLFQNMSDFSPQYGSSEVLNSDGTRENRGEGQLKLRKIFNSTFNFVDGRTGQPVAFSSRYERSEAARRRRSGRGGEKRKRKIKVH